MPYSQKKASSDGSFLMVNGNPKFIGNQLSNDPNTVVTFDSETSSMQAVPAGKLFKDLEYAVSMITNQPPEERPNGDDLEIGDFWTNKRTSILYVWDGDEWLPIAAINGNPVGTIITNINTDPLAPPPSGYLKCDGTPCPPEYEDLRQLLLASTGSFVLPTRAPGVFIKF